MAIISIITRDVHLSYSTDQMQSIRRTRFDRILIAFIASDELVYRWQRTCLLLEANAFIASDERV